jgi:hypothetical protein
MERADAGNRPQTFSCQGCAGSGIGARLMFTDATIMCRNLADLNREGIVALPIHDSVIVQAKHESRAFEIMGLQKIRPKVGA